MIKAIEKIIKEFKALDFSYIFKKLKQYHIIYILFFLIISFLFVGRGILSNSFLNSSDIFFDKEMFGGDNIPYNPILSDSAMVHYPNNYFFWENIKRGNWSEYRGLNLLGTSFGGNSIVGFYMNIFSLFFDSSLGMTLSSVLVLALIGYFMFVFIQYLTKNNLVSLFAGIVWMLCTHQIVWMQFPQHPLTQMWIPLLFYFYIKVIRETNLKDSLFLIIILFLHLNSGYSQVTIYTLLYLAIFVFSFLIIDFLKNRNIKSMLKKGLYLLIITIIPLLLISGSLLKVSNRISDGLRGTQESNLLEECAICNFSSFFTEMTGFVSPDIYGNGFEYQYTGPVNVVEYSRYFGIIPLLALILIPFIKKKFLSILFFSISTLFLLIMLNVPPFGQLFKLIPFVSYGHYTRIITVVLFGYIVSSSITLAKFIKCKFQKRVWILRFLEIMIAFSIVGFVLILMPNIYDKFVGFLNNFSHLRAWLDILNYNNYLLFVRNAFFILIGFALFLYFIYQKLKDKLDNFNLLMIGFIVFTLFDIGCFSFFFNTFTPNKYNFPDFSGLENITRDTDNSRVHISSKDIFFFPPNTNVIYGLETIDGYSTLMDLDYAEIFKRSFDNVFFSENGVMFSSDSYSEILDLFNVKYVISNIKDEKVDNLDEIYRDDYITIYKNTDFLSRLFFTNGYEVISDTEKVIDKLIDPDFDEQEKIILNKEPNIEVSSYDVVGEVSGIKVYTESVTAEVQDQDGGWLVFSQAYDPNWHAYIDGEEIEIYEADGVLMGIYVDKGRYNILFKYEEKSMRLMSLVKIVFFGLIALLTVYFMIIKKDYSWISIFVLSIMILVVFILPIILNNMVLLCEIAKYQ